MTRNPESMHSELPATTRSRVRFPDALVSGRLFPGWGPGLSR